jgi:pimeloyl-ACP methyl ester carboxylesterase
MTVHTTSPPAPPGPPKGPIQRPPSLLTLAETVRVGFEASALLMSSPWLGASPMGDGHAVLVIPGFATNDATTLLLRMFLKLRGHSVHTWDLGYNLDHRTTGLKGERLEARINALREQSGRKVSLVGWSLGGVLAREAARRMQHDVRQVVTLGSPFAGDPTANALRTLYEYLSETKVDAPAALARAANGGEPLPVPSTAVFSRTDGIAPWENCHGRTDAITENVEVHSSHFGMVANPAVFHIVADRLAQPEGAWQPFERSGAFAMMYPLEAAA